MVDPSPGSLQWHSIGLVGLKCSTQAIQSLYHTCRDLREHDTMIIAANLCPKVATTRYERSSSDLRIDQHCGAGAAKLHESALGHNGWRHLARQGAIGDLHQGTTSNSDTRKADRRRHAILDEGGSSAKCKGSAYAHMECEWHKKQNRRLPSNCIPRIWCNTTLASQCLPTF